MITKSDDFLLRTLIDCVKAVLNRNRENYFHCSKVFMILFLWYVEHLIVANCYSIILFKYIIWMKYNSILKFYGCRKFYTWYIETDSHADFEMLLRQRETYVYRVNSMKVNIGLNLNFLHVYIHFSCFYNWMLFRLL